MVEEFIKKRGPGRPPKTTVTVDVPQVIEIEKKIRVKGVWPQPGDKVVINKKEHPDYRMHGEIVGVSNGYVSIKLPALHGKSRTTNAAISDIAKWRQGK